jgi:hypothetical protein
MNTNNAERKVEGRNNSRNDLKQIDKEIKQQYES